MCTGVRVWERAHAHTSLSFFLPGNACVNGSRCPELLRQAENGGEPVILSAAYEVSSFGYFQRSGCVAYCCLCVVSLWGETNAVYDLNGCFILDVTTASAK